MTKPSLFRTALQVSPERIAVMKDIELKQFMRELLLAQAHRSGSPLSEVSVNTQDYASDGGCDAWTAKPTRKDEWLGETDTCWQFKSGKQGEPAKLKGEVGKTKPKSTLQSGGRFVVIASGATSGETGRQSRHSLLSEEAKMLGLPTESIVVLCSEHLATWCNQHPAIAARWSGRHPGQLILSEWLREEIHQNQWYASNELMEKIIRLQGELDYVQGDLRHLHIHGQPGVGKTRLALELCRDAPWSNSVIYCEQSNESEIISLIDDAAGDENVSLTIVADEVQKDQLIRLRNAIGRAHSSIRLITIGHCKITDSARISGLSVLPVDQTMLCRIVRAWYPSMPIQKVQFVARFSDGYVRLAKLAADAVAGGNTSDTHGLFGRDDIQYFLDRMLETENRRSLHVVAALESVGWSETVEAEGKSIAAVFELDWNQVKADVQAFHKRLRIAPCSGRYRYISPQPLGIYLALDAWDTFPKLMSRLRDSLPTEEAINAYDRRLASTFENAEARNYAKTQLRLIGSKDQFFTASNLRHWSSLSPADPELASNAILLLLENAPLENRARIRGEARRVAVTTLVGLSKFPRTFHRAAKALALLAEAENEAWSNNATGEFLARFLILHGGTATPYIERLTVIEEIASYERIALIQLSVKSLVMVSDQHRVPSCQMPLMHEAPIEDWRPSTVTEYNACVVAGLRRLRQIASVEHVGLVGDWVKAAGDLSMLLRNRSIRPELSLLFGQILTTYPKLRESIRATIWSIIHSERNHWKELHEDDLSELEELHSQYEDYSLIAQLMQLVGPSPWDRVGAQDFGALAVDFIRSAESRPEMWGWLMSGEAGNCCRFGEVLAEKDVSFALLDEIQQMQFCDGDLRALCGYIEQLRRRQGDTWYNDWYREQANLRPRPVRMLLELAWRSSATPVVVNCVQEMLSSESIDPSWVKVLSYSNWKEDLDVEAFRGVVRSLIETRHEATALEILGQRIDKYDEVSTWEKEAIELLANPCLISRGHTIGYYWNKVALRYIDTRARTIATAIFREHSNGSKFFLGGGRTEEVLIKCADFDPHGVWEALSPYLSCPETGHSFTYGFPTGVLDRLAHDKILAWANEDPNVRPAMIARLLVLDAGNDESLASRILEIHGKREDVSAGFFAALLGSESRGPLSEHWYQLADTLLTSAARSELHGLKSWSQDAAKALKEMAERERQRENEFDLGRGR